jgi:hypothetical protein
MRLAKTGKRNQSSEVFLGDGAWILEQMKIRGAYRRDRGVKSLASLEKVLQKLPFHVLWIQREFVDEKGRDALELVLLLRDRFPQIQVDILRQAYIFHS